MQGVPAKTALYLSTTMMDQHFGYLEDEDLILRHISICEEQMIDKWIDRKIDIERDLISLCQFKIFHATTPSRY